MSIGRRVREAREKLNLEQGDLAKLLKTSQQSISWIENDKTKNPRKLKEIAKVLKVSEMWLRYGDKSNDFDIIPIFEIETGQMIESGNLIIRKIPLLTWNDLMQAKDIKEILTNLKDAEYIKEMFKESEYFDDNLFAIRVPEGGAMEAEGNRQSLTAGDTIIVDPDIKPTNKKLVLVRFDGNCMIRQYVQDGTFEVLKAFNKSYPVIDFKTVETLGVIIKRSGRDL